jgi:hypothetical protein
MAQVSVNITDHEVTPLHVVYEEICKEARVITDNIDLLFNIWCSNVKLLLIIS